MLGPDAFEVHSESEEQLEYSGAEPFEYVIVNQVGQVVQKGSATEVNGKLSIPTATGVYIFKNLSNGQIYRFAR